MSCTIRSTASDLAVWVVGVVVGGFSGDMHAVSDSAVTSAASRPAILIGASFAPSTRRVGVFAERHADHDPGSASVAAVPGVRPARRAVIASGSAGVQATANSIGSVCRPVMAINGFHGRSRR